MALASAQLSTVMCHVDAVVWLPRSRTGASPSYQFRLWVRATGAGISPPHAAHTAALRLSRVRPQCTFEASLPRASRVARVSSQCSFEASVVAKRRLPVYVAGQGLTRSQHALRRLGIFLPALPGLSPPNEIRALTYINGSLAIMCAVCPLFIPIAGVMQSGPIGQAIPHLGLEIARARNGQHVLRAMHEGMQRVAALARLDGEHRSAGELDTSNTRLRRSLTRRFSLFLREEQTLHDNLGKMLPWLPVRRHRLEPPPRERPRPHIRGSDRSRQAYDRRDALVVWDLLRHGALGSATQQLEGNNEEQLKALAASCFAAALMEPSDGDSVGSLKVDAWLRQKGIELQMERPVRLAALDKHGWNVFRGSPDVLVIPTGRLRVPTPPAVAPTGGSQMWDASTMEPVAEVPVAAQVVPLLCYLVATTLSLLIVFVTLAVELSTSRDDGDRIVLRSTLWGVTIIAPPLVLALYTMIATWFLLPWVYNYPHAAHVMSLGGVSGAVGYDAVKELGGVFLTSFFNIGFIAFLLILIDTAAFSQPTELFSSAFTTELANASHPGVTVGPAAYATLLTYCHGWSLNLAVVASHATWHMWNCGRRSGARYMFVSPDSMKGTLVSFARPADTAESI